MSSYSKLNQPTTAFFLKRRFWKKNYVYFRNSAVQLNQSQNVPIKMKTILLHADEAKNTFLA